jgi:hypothetical protein
MQKINVKYKIKRIIGIKLSWNGKVVDIFSISLQTLNNNGYNNNSYQTST